jgi:hypothetical protein
MEQPIIQFPGNPNMRKGAPSVNMAGRPLSSRNQISRAILKDLEAAWHVHGQRVLDTLAKEDPAKFAQLAVGILPKDVLVKVEAQNVPKGIEPHEWEVFRQVLDVIEAAAPGAERERTFAALESYLRSELAEEVLPAPIMPPCPVPLPIGKE